MGRVGYHPVDVDLQPPGAFPLRCTRTSSGHLGRPLGEGGLGGSPPACVIPTACGRGQFPPAPQVLQPPGRAARQILGLREPDPSLCSTRSWRPPTAEVFPTRGSPPLRRECWHSLGGWTAPPMARPLSHSCLSFPAGSDGAGRTVPIAPHVVLPWDLIHRETQTNESNS